MGIDWEKKFEEMIAEGAIMRPVFTGGINRSGTTVITWALADHPNVIGNNEIAWFLGFSDFTNRMMGAEGEKWRSHKCWGTEERHLLRGIRELFFKTIFGEDLGKRYLVDRKKDWRKSPIEKWSAKITICDETMQASKILFPEARFVLMHRCGIDVVHSRMNLEKYPIVFEKACIQWNDMARIRILDRLEDERCLLLKHQDLVEDSDGLARRVLSFCGLPYAEEVAAYLSRNMVNTSFPEERKGFRNVSFLRRSNPWSLWDSEQKATFKRVCGDSMDALGYRIP